MLASIGCPGEGAVLTSDTFIWAEPLGLNLSAVLKLDVEIFSFRDDLDRLAAAINQIMCLGRIGGRDFAAVRSARRSVPQKSTVNSRTRNQRPF
jgi:hypothetical protein